MKPNPGENPLNRYSHATKRRSQLHAGVLTNLSYVGLRVLMPAVIAVMVFGVWMVLAFSGWQFTQLWILLALGAFGLAFVIGAVYLSRIALALDKLTATDFDLETARDHLNRWIVGYQIVLLILIFAVWDMVFKPGI